VEVFLIRFWNCLFTSVSFLIALSSCSPPPPQALSTGPPKPVLTAAQLKDIWVSQTTGKEYRATVYGNVFHAEWVNIPPDLAAHGSFIKTDCKRQGSKWVGTSSSFVPCSLGKGPGSKLDNWCHLETTIEIDSITADRISGRGETLKKFDCQKCKILESGTKDFFWVPKK
jgi:hypothetical protein